MVLVTGASGQVGKHLLQALSAKGISSRAWILLFFKLKEKLILRLF